MLRRPVAPPLRLPDDMHSSPQRIVICHPGYPADGSHWLFDLECLDCVSPTASITEPGTLRGVQYAVVHAACGIVANNRFDGYLTTLSSTERLAYADGDIVPSGSYYFRLDPAASSAAFLPAPDLSIPYPVVPNFRQWSFPGTAALPASWTSCLLPPSIHSEAKHRDGSCRITAHSLSTSLAHIVPDSERLWFERNGMHHFRIITPRSGDILGGPENRLLLRQDVHLAWDLRKFSIVPKRDSDNSCHWTVHVNETSPSDLVTEYHNLRLQQLTGVSREYLFARFAWDIFPCLMSFFKRDCKRFLSTTAHPAGQWHNAEAARGYIQGQGSGRSESSPRRKGATSPSKRARSEQDAEEQDAEEQDVEGRLSRDGGRGKRRKTRSWRSDSGECESPERGGRSDTGQQHTSGCQTQASDVGRRSSLDSGLGGSFRSASKTCIKVGVCDNTEVESDHEGSESTDYGTGDEQDGDEVDQEQLELDRWLQKEQSFQDALAYDEYDGWSDPPRGRKRRRSTSIG